MQVVTKIAGIYAERLMSDVMYVFFYISLVPLCILNRHCTHIFDMLVYS
jgi:hypothetical protein